MILIQNERLPIKEKPSVYVHLIAGEIELYKQLLTSNDGAEANKLAEYTIRSDGNKVRWQ